MLQIKKRRDSARAMRLMCTIVFYQDTRHEKPLHWIHGVLGIGYLSRRNDGMSELRINGFTQVRDILSNLVPYIRFKKVQAVALLKATTILSGKPFKKLARKELVLLARCMVAIQKDNYAARSKKSLSEIQRLLGLTP